MRARDERAVDAGLEPPPSPDLLVGLTLGIVLGRLAWREFAGSIGVVPVSVVPVLLLAAGLAALVLTGNLLASLPAVIAARTRAALILKAE